MKNIVTIPWLSEHLADPNIVIADCRFTLGQSLSGRANYEEGHIPGAVYLDLEQHLSGSVGSHGGRHPLPDLKDLAETLGRSGIDRSVTVVAYDDQGGAMASRLWWLMKYMGHSDVYILDGGYSRWVAAGLPITSEIVEPSPVVYITDVQEHMLVHMEEVRGKLHSDQTVLIDSREAPRYKGLVEPIDRVAGHIPGAANYFWKDGLAADGTWRTQEQQAERFTKLDRDAEVIVYCGSGVTACPNVIALNEAGFHHVKLYAGSWSDWISYSENPVATGEE